MGDEKNKYITAYGSSNEDSYGRGDVTDISTKYNMLTTNPLSGENAPEMNSYSSDGSYNQDIFGWKCFNSPVSFRNGIYGECGYVTTFSDNDFHGIKIATYNIGDNDNKSKIIIKADNIELDGDVGDLEVKHAESADYAIKADVLSYNGNEVVSTSSATTVAPNRSNSVNLGSSTIRFLDIYANSIIARTQLFKSSDTFELYDIRPVYIRLKVEYESSNSQPVTIEISDGDEFYVDNEHSMDSFGNADTAISKISIDGSEAGMLSNFMIPQLSSQSISLIRNPRWIDFRMKKFKCLSYDSQTGTPQDYAGGGSFLNLDFYIIVMRIE